MRNKIIRFFDHYLLLILLSIIVVLTPIFLYHSWSDSRRVQIISALSSLAVSVLLAAVTWQYVRTTQRTLDFYQNQWNFEHQFRIRFGMKIRNGRPWVRIANPGGVRFMVSKAVFADRTSPPHTLITYTILNPGETGGFYVPRRVYESAPHNADVDVTLHYEHSGKPEETTSRSFRIELLQGKIYGIKAGVHGIWQVDCPTCGKLGGWLILSKLNNLEDANAREKEMKNELAATCPQHQSKWADSVEQIRERNQADKERGTEE
jgi:hypothetical protein